ncbi:MAG: histidine--tRNA ligase [Anaerolineae bacterium]|nr:histidine--tRNA ligase [Anaerolineae bacterium]
MTSELIRPVKGTKDYYPEEMRVRTWLYQKVREVSESFGYQEWDAPFLESLDLYAAKSGQEIVEKQSYVFTDRGGDQITLRPDLTPSLARLVAAKQNQLIFPLRWWSFGPFWRYERPQKGRGREFFQWNIDLIGDDTPAADAELAAIAAAFMKSLGLQPDEVSILVNNRPLMDAATEKVGIGKGMRPQAYKLIDRRDKMPPEAWEKYAGDLGFSNKQLGGLKEVMSNQELWQQSPALVDFFSAIEVYGVGDYVKFAPQVIRGLDYYTGTVFEAWDTKGEFRSLFGGGRYDNLVDDVGGDPVPAVGFAVGNMVITLLLEKLGRLPKFENTPSQVMITLFDSDHIKHSLSLAGELRQAGINVITHNEPVKLSKQFKYAHRIGVPYAVVLGPEEIADNKAALKNLDTGEQQSISRAGLVKHIRGLLESRMSS